jgi:hypothetical protein
MRFSFLPVILCTVSSTINYVPQLAAGKPPLSVFLTAAAKNKSGPPLKRWGAAAANSRIPD